MDQVEDSCQVKRVSSLEHIASEPDSISSLDSDSCLSEEEQVGGIISLSPLCTQYKDKMRIVDSNPSCDCVLVSDEEIVESMYQNLLRIVISLQLQGNNSDILCFDGCKTPPSRLSDTKTVPDTCPGAPMKLAKISRNIDSGLRRKLF